MNTATLVQLAPLVLLIFIMYFLLIRPQKKKEKSVNQMRSNLRANDYIVTIGGIYGKVVKVKDETLIIEVGSDKTKFEVARWAISKVQGQEPGATSKKTGKESKSDDAADEKKQSKRARLVKNGTETEQPVPAETPEADVATEAEDTSKE